MRVPKWLALGGIPLLALLAVMLPRPPESEANPVHLLAAIPGELRGRPVFNGYTFGGPLILAGIKPYIDGRAEIYGDEFVADYANILRGDVGAFDHAVRRYDIRWTMLPPSESRLIEAIESSGKWKRIHSDNVGIIDVRIAEPKPDG